MSTFIFSFTPHYLKSEIVYSVHVHEHTITTTVEYKNTQVDKGSMANLLQSIMLPTSPEHNYHFKGGIESANAISICFGRDSLNQLILNVKDTNGNTFEGSYGLGALNLGNLMPDLPTFWQPMIDSICQVVFPSIIYKMIDQLERNIPFKVGSVLVEYGGIRYPKKFLWNHFTTVAHWKDLRFSFINGFLFAFSITTGIELFKLDCAKESNSVVLPDLADFMATQIL
jgi:hypothetical protein